MVGWHHRLNGHESEQTPKDSEGQGSLACCSPWGCNCTFSDLGFSNCIRTTRSRLRDSATKQPAYAWRFNQREQKKSAHVSASAVSTNERHEGFLLVWTPPRLLSDPPLFPPRANSPPETAFKVSSWFPSPPPSVHQRPLHPAAGQAFISG